MRGWCLPGPLRGEKEENSFKQARETGYLRLFGNDACRRRLIQAWFADRKELDLPCVSASFFFSYKPRRGYVSIEVKLRGSWWMTTRLLEALKTFLKPDEHLYLYGDHFNITGLPLRDLGTRTQEVVSLITLMRPTESERYDAPPRRVQGVFPCLNIEGFEGELIEGHSYFVKELPDQDGHVLVFRPDGPPLVGIHLDQFDY